MKSGAQHCFRVRHSARERRATFGTMERAVEAIERPAADPAGQAALAIARDDFHSGRVLNRLLDEAACHG